MKIQSPFCPSCLEYRQSLESILDEVTVLLENAIEDFREFDGGSLYRGRIDALSLVKKRLEETLYESEPDESGFISLVDAIEPGEPGYREPLHETLDRIMVKASEIGGSLKTINSMVTAMAC